LLNERLPKAHRVGAVAKRAYAPKVPPRVVCRLTKLGEEFATMLDGTDRPPCEFERG